MKKYLLVASLIFASISSFAQENYELDEVVVTSSTKETTELKNLPTALSIISPMKLSVRGIESLKDISTLVPNFYIPNYGSKMATPIYLRGVGTRSSSQSVGVYVNGVPFMDKSTFDFEMMDIARIEILRGPQGTLYGRNAMGGIVNIYTLSPLEYSGTKVAVGAGNYGNYSAKLSHYHTVSDRVGVSFGGYYDRSAGYFTNAFDNKKVDNEESMGANAKLHARLGESLVMKLETSFDHTDQGAYPYGLYDSVTRKVAQVNYNDEGTYHRAVWNNSLRFEYALKNMMFSSTTGYQYLDDNMMMDQDFTEKSIFTINQIQKQHSLNQEFALRSTGDSRYQWSVGLFAFHNDMKVRGDVTFKEDGIAGVIQPKIDEEMAAAPMRLRINDKVIPNPGTYATPSTGVALFHQSTFDVTDKFSVTAGIRLDYEKQKFRYDTEMTLNTSVVMKPPRPPMEVGTYVFEKKLTGKLDQSFVQILPKLAVKYAFSEKCMAYATVSKGYKAGGYNNQMFSEVIMDSIRVMRPTGMPTPPAKGEGDLSKVVSYKPEMTWNYEVGTRARLGHTNVEFVGFYMDIDDLQLTQFVDGGSGRILSNSGRGRSFGAEVSISSRLTDRLSIDANYGYTNAKFTKYDGGENKAGDKVDYTGNFIPHTPSHTASLGASYVITPQRGFIDRIVLSSNVNGCGKIYWTEKNDIEQPFYAILNAKASLHHKLCRLELWGQNLTSTDYGTFYFESFKKAFVQKGRPLTFGANLIMTF